MFPFTHFVLASRLKPYVDPTLDDEYFFGAMIPDIRYLSSIPREQTHLEMADLYPMFDQYPEHHAFLTGYFIHCLIDDLEPTLNKRLLRRFPLILARPVLRLRHAAVIVDLYLIDSASERGQIKGQYNRILADLNVPQADVAPFCQQLNQLLAAPSFEGQLAVAGNFGINVSAKTGYYLYLYQKLMAHPTWLPFIFDSVRMAQYEAVMLNKIVSASPFKKLKAILAGTGVAANRSISS